MAKVTQIYSKKVYGVTLDDGETYTCVVVNDNGNEIFKVQHDSIKVSEGAIRLVKLAIQSMGGEQ